MLMILSFSRRLRIFFWGNLRMRHNEQKKGILSGAGALCLLVGAFIILASPSWSSAFSSDSIRIKDFSGKSVIIQRSPGRIISTAPGITECLFSLGLEERIVAVTNNCNYPPEARSLPRIGDLQLNVEKIVELRPDLIITDVTLHLEQVRRLEGLGFKVLAIDCSTIAKFRLSLAMLGKATAREEKAELLLADLDERIEKITKRLCPSETRADTTVFIEIWDKPLMTAGSKTFFDDLIRLAGGSNTFADTSTSYPRINIESLIRKDPQVIILTTSKREEVVSRSCWKDISAVREGRIHEINPDIIARPTLRMLEALELMALWLHPEIRSTKLDVLAMKSPGPARETPISTRGAP
jgi:iron complex transport system substrate-binding protein